MQYPLCSKHDYTTDYVMEFRQKNSGKQYQITEKTTRKELLDILKIYRGIKRWRDMQIERFKENMDEER